MATSNTATIGAGTTALRAADVLGGIGVDTHVAYTDGGYANVGNIKADLAYLGVTKVRDGISDGENGSAPLSSYIALARAGITFTFVVGGGTSTTASIQYTLGKIAALAAAVPGSVDAIEGPNEVNNQTLTFNGQGGLAGAVSLQSYLYQAVKSNPSLSGVRIDYFTGYDNGSIGMGPDPSTTPGLADFDTQHPYPQGGGAPASWVDPAVALPNEPGAKGPFVYTETGYTTRLSDVNGVDATVQGKYTLDLLMDTAKDGASATYLYELMDAYAAGSPQGDAGYGLFDTANAPKLAATGIHNLTAILADTGASASTFTPAALPYTLTGLPQTGNTLEIAKSDGTTDIVVWAEPTLWSNKAEVAAPSETVTVGLDGLHAVSVYDPLLGSAPIATYAATGTVAIAITDHPLVIAVGPKLGAGASAAATGGTQAVATQGGATAATATTTTATTTADATGSDAAAVPLGAASAGGASLLGGSAATSTGTADAGTAATGTQAAVTDPGFTAVTNRNGSRTVDVTAPGHVIASDYRDTFQVHGMAETTFVFDPGYGHDVLNAFRVDGAAHDTLSLPGADFRHSIAAVLRHTQTVAGGVRIVDPTSGDSISLTGVTKAQLLHNRQDFAFHDTTG